MSKPIILAPRAVGGSVERDVRDRFADVINLKDYGAVGDGVTDDKDAWDAFQDASGGLKYIPAGQYNINGTVKDFASGCIGNGDFDNDAGYWSQVHITDGRIDNTILRHATAYNASSAVLDSVVKVQANVEYNRDDPSTNTNFTRVIGGYFEGIGHGDYAWSRDSATGNFTTFAATAHNKFAGQFGMTAITGRVWDANESEVPNIATKGASKSCAGYFPFVRRSKYENGGYMIGIETYCMNNATETQDVPYQNSDAWGNNFASWTAGYHCTGTASGAPITAGIMMDGNTNAKHAFWNGIVIGGSAMRINNNGAGTVGTIGISLASWTGTSCGDIGIKFGAAGRWHQYYKSGFAFHAGNTAQESHNSNTTFAIRCGNAYNSALYLQRGATEFRTGTPSTIGAFRTGSTLNSELATTVDYTEIESAGYQRFVVTPFVVPPSVASPKVYVLSSFTFAPAFGGSSSSATSLGTSDHKWNHVYAVDGTIQTSDERVKQDIEDIPDAVLDAWGNVNLCQFRLREAVAEKGDSARTHTGVIAQEVKRSFEDAGLDASQYGLLCHDSWGDQYEEVSVKDADEVVDEDTGWVITPEQRHTERVLVKTAGDQYSVRYDEALIMECAYLRREIARIKTAMGANE